MEITISFDTRHLDESIQSLDNFLDSRSFERFQNQVFGYIASLSTDIVLGEGITTIGANGSIEVLYPLRFGSRFENLMSTLRANKTDGIAHRTFL